MTALITHYKTLLCPWLFLATTGLGQVMTSPVSHVLILVKYGSGCGQVTEVPTVNLLCIMPLRHYRHKAFKGLMKFLTCWWFSADNAKGRQKCQSWPYPHCYYCCCNWKRCCYCLIPVATHTRPDSHKTVVVVVVYTSSSSSIELYVCICWTISLMLTK